VYAERPMSEADDRRAVQWVDAGLQATVPPLLQDQHPWSEHILLWKHHQITNETMSDAEVKNDVAAEAPSAEELKAKKRTAEDDDVDVKKQKTENGDHENGEDEEDAEEEEDLGEEEEDLDGEGEDELDEEDGGEDDEEGEEEEGEDEGEEGE